MVLASAFTVTLLAMLTTAPAGAQDQPLGDRIAELLCYPDAAETMALSAEDTAAYTGSFTLSGGYRDIQGAEGRADFTKKGPIAECRWWASVSQELFYCAKVSIRDTVLTKGRARLCF